MFRVSQILIRQALRSGTIIGSGGARGYSGRHPHILIPSYHKQIDIPQKPLPHFILERMEKVEPSKVALECAMSGVKVTYGDGIKLIKSTAAYFAKTGLHPGQTVLINAPNIPHYPVFFQGILLAGGVVSPASPQHSLEELVTQLIDSGATFVVTVPLLLDVTLEAAHAAGIPNDRVIVMGGDGSKGTTSHTAVFSAPIDQLPVFNRDIVNDPAVLPYSSGTSGKSKGVMLSHRNLIANLLQVCAAEKAPSTLLGILPFFHIYGLMLLLNFSLYYGSTTAVLPKFELPVFLQTLEKYKIERAHLVPPIILALAKHPLVANYDLSSLKMIFSGAAPLGKEVEQAVEARLGCKVKQAWGMSELSPAATISPDEVLKEGSVGPLLPNTLGRIAKFDDDGKHLHDCGPKEEGEILIKGPQVMLGYLNRPDATKECLSSDGWLRTGDTAYYDEQGFIYITDRIKEFMKYKGHQVAPSELEAVLLTHPKITDCCVVGSPNEAAGEIPKAFVVLQSGTAPSEDLALDIKAHVAKHVAPYKRIHLVEFIDTIPKSAAGKILRRVLRDHERQRVKNLSS